MVWVRLPVYFYKRNDTFYFSRSIPSDLQHRFKKRKIEVSLRTKSESKAAKSAAALSDRLERYWDSLRMEMIYSRELGLKVLQDTKYPIAIISACRMRWRSIIASKAKAKPNFSMMYQTEVFVIYRNAWNTTIYQTWKYLTQEGSETICSPAACHPHQSNACSLQLNQSLI